MHIFPDIDIVLRCAGEQGMNHYLVLQAYQHECAN